MEANKMLIREAVIEDLHILRKFEQGIIQFERQFTSNIKKDPVRYYDLEDLILRNDAQVLVATIDEEIIASAYALIKKSKPYLEPAKYAYLGFMFVSPQHRGKGINGKITEEILNR